MSKDKLAVSGGFKATHEVCIPRETGISWVPVILLYKRGNTAFIRDCGGHSGKVSIDSIRSIKIKETGENE